MAKPAETTAATGQEPTEPAAAEPNLAGGAPAQPDVADLAGGDSGSDGVIGNAAEEVTENTINSESSIAARILQLATSAAQATAWTIEPEGHAAFTEPGVDWQEAARFIVANRDAPERAIPIHLAMRKRNGAVPGWPTVWTVFRTVYLTLHDHFEAQRKAAATEPLQPRPVRRSDLAMTPDRAPLTPTGFSAQR